MYAAALAAIPHAVIYPGQGPNILAVVGYLTSKV